MSFLGTAMLILVIAVVVLAILAVALFIIHKRLKKKVVVKEQIEQKENIIKNKLENLRHSNIVPQESLKSLDELAKSFLKETFKIEKNPIKVEEKPFEFPKEEEKITLPLVIMPQREKMMRQINSLDEEQIRDAYAELQKEFTQAYEIAEITKNEKIRGELEKFRESMKKRVDDYAKYNKIIEFAQE